MFCRACRNKGGQVVLDLGDQPACDYFPSKDEPGPDPVYPLQMWLCAACGLAQLVADPTVPDEPRGVEPAALVEQAEAAVDQVFDAGLLVPGARVIEYGSPHGGSWLPLLAARSVTEVHDNDEADVILDCFGLMHCADQEAALAERVARLSQDGILLVQYHSLATIVRDGQWNALRHGHYAYYSTRALLNMLAAVGFSPLRAWWFDLYGGTILLAASRQAQHEASADSSVGRLVAQEDELDVGNPGRLSNLQRIAELSAEALHRWLTRQRNSGTSVLGYGAASRAVALLCRAAIDRSLLPAIADASTAKQGRRMPGTDIPVISPAELVDARPQAVLLFLPDLLDEVRERLPRVESSGGHWIDIESLFSEPVG
jgi:hypothetical protein